jgi:small subunit ribosomal protein S6
LVRDYELMYIVRPDIDEDAVKNAVESVKSLMENHGGEVVKTTTWGKRRLAYEVNQYRDGNYVIANVRLEGAKIADIERELRIHDAVFRHLLILHEGPPVSADTPIEPPQDIVEEIPADEKPISVDDEDFDEEVIPAAEEEGEEI